MGFGDDDKPTLCPLACVRVGRRGAGRGRPRPRRRQAYPPCMYICPCPCPSPFQDVLELCGGGDWHMAYLLDRKSVV